MEAYAHVEAADADEARQKALETAQNGDLVWSYTGAEDDFEVDEPEQE